MPLLLKRLVPAVCLGIVCFGALIGSRWRSVDAGVTVEVGAASASAADVRKAAALLLRGALAQSGDPVASSSDAWIASLEEATLAAREPALARELTRGTADAVRAIADTAAAPSPRGEREITLRLAQTIDAASRVYTLTLVATTLPARSDERASARLALRRIAYASGAGPRNVLWFGPGAASLPLDYARETGRIVLDEVYAYTVPTANYGAGGTYVVNGEPIADATLSLRR
jgi:hypothetical protein